MRILFIINYPSWHKIKRGEMPNHHLFGIFQLIDYFDSENTAILKNGKGKIEFLCFTNSSLSKLLKLYIKSFKYDILYDTLCSVSKTFGILNKYHLLRPRLITIFHHPPFVKIMKNSKSDVSIFFTKELLLLAHKSVKDNRFITFNQWYPDIEWYLRNSISLNKEKLYDFLDNGKTGRDHNKFIKSVEKLDSYRGLIVTDHKHIPENYKDNSNIELYFQDKPNDKQILSVLVHSTIMVIPLIETKNILGPIGYTSYIDALALGMPIVAPSNAAFAQEIADNKLGILYDPMKNEFSTELMLAIKNYEVLSQNVKTFASTHTIKEYAKNLQKILFRK